MCLCAYRTFPCTLLLRKLRWRRWATEGTGAVLGGNASTEMQPKQHTHTSAMRQDMCIWWTVLCASRCREFLIISVAFTIYERCKCQFGKQHQFKMSPLQCTHTYTYEIPHTFSVNSRGFVHTHTRMHCVLIAVISRDNTRIASAQLWMPYAHRVRIRNVFACSICGSGATLQAY